MCLCISLGTFFIYAFLTHGIVSAGILGSMFFLRRNFGHACETRKLTRQRLITGTNALKGRKLIIVSLAYYALQARGSYSFLHLRLEVWPC